MSQPDDDFDAALATLMAAIDSLSAHHGWKKKKRSIRSQVMDAQNVRRSADIWSDVPELSVRAFKVLSRQALEFTEGARWKEAESTIELVIQILHDPIHLEAKFLQSSWRSEHVAAADGGGVVINISREPGGHGESRLHGEPGLAPTKLPAPPKPEDD